MDSCISVRETIGVTRANVGSGLDLALLRESFEAFFAKEADRLYGALVMITGDSQEAEELAQDAFLAVWQRWDYVRSLESPTGYLYRTAMNGFRKWRRRSALRWRLREHRPPEVDRIEQAETRYLVRRALASLTPRQRAALVLTELLGYNSEDAARLMATRAGTVRVLASQGRATMRRSMEGSNE
jgi:RNA polymerase sigma factor (sigma-70 family)